MSPFGHPHNTKVAAIVLTVLLKDRMNGRVSDAPTRRLATGKLIIIQIQEVTCPPPC